MVCLSGRRYEFRGEKKKREEEERVLIVLIDCIDRLIVFIGLGFISLFYLLNCIVLYYYYGIHIIPYHNVFAFICFDLFIH